MDLVGACRAFVSVGERGGFTVGAAAARMSQPVASRRIAALEERLGERLFERTSRRAAVLTPFGRDLLPAARQLVQAADDLIHEARAARGRPVRLAVPGTCSAVALAHLVAEARDQGLVLDLRVAPPARRAELVRLQQVRAALLAVPADEAVWSVPLGLAGAGDPGVNRVYLETLRLGRGSTGPARHVWLQPEDDVPHLRDPLTRLRDALGLRPGQLAVAADPTTALAEVLRTRDLLLCSSDQAREFGLHWRPVGELSLGRGYALAAEGDPRPLRDQLDDALARCLGAPAGDSPGTGRTTRTGRTTSTGPAPRIARTGGREKGPAT
ncbi:LysR family transcriptional regulator [Streptomyces sp. NPDC052095]|uniref:LysR family transcriptional regulator n=1 Tax=unclassified Streptomyces TaxID=2593676 RepID=UPI00344F7CF6